MLLIELQKDNLSWPSNHHNSLGSTIQFMFILCRQEEKHGMKGSVLFEVEQVCEIVQTPNNKKHLQNNANKTEHMHL